MANSDTKTQPGHAEVVAHFAKCPRQRARRLTKERRETKELRGTFCLSWLERRLAFAGAGGSGLLGCGFYVFHAVAAVFLGLVETGVGLR
jgi:hypothetical protein